MKIKKIKKIRYMHILRLIILALDECSLDPYDLPADVNSFNAIVVQYGKRSLVDEDEVNYVLKTSLSKMFFKG